MDGTLAVHGQSDLPLDAEFIAFDIETTGLHLDTNRMTEIGAVLFSGGEIKAEFDTSSTRTCPSRPRSRA